MAVLPADTWCPRLKCQRARVCGYMHNCKAMTLAEAAVKQVEWEAERLRREEEAQQERLAEERRRYDRNAKIEAMLAAWGLTLYDLEKFIKEIVHG